MSLLSVFRLFSTAKSLESHVKLLGPALIKIGQAFPLETLNVAFAGMKFKLTLGLERTA